MKAIANVSQVVEISEKDMGEALKGYLLKKHRRMFGLLSAPKQFFVIKRNDMELLNWNDDWQKQNPDDSILADAANILLQR